LNPCYITGYTKLLVGAGFKNNSELTKAEIIDLESSKSHCDKTNEFPVNAHGVIGGLGFDDVPLICGGSVNQQNCYSLKKSAWSDASKPLTEKRLFASSCPSPFPKKPNKQIVVGGVEGNGISPKNKLLEFLAKNLLSFE